MCTVPVGDIPLSFGGAGNHTALGIYLQDTRFLLGKTLQKQTGKWFWGLGFWTRANPELCLIATKGRPKRVSKAVHCIVDTPVERHSKKPDDVRLRIEQLMGEVSRVELFARQNHDGWTCLGDEIDGLDIREAIQKLKEKEDLDVMDE